MVVADQCCKVLWRLDYLHAFFTLGREHLGQVEPGTRPIPIYLFKNHSPHWTGHCKLALRVPGNGRRTRGIWVRSS